MKNTIYYIGAWCLLLVSCGQPVYITTTTVQPRPVVQQQPEPPQYEQSFQIFYDELAPYGKWIDYPGEGYVWCPRVEANFQPYSTRGNWVNTEHGWTWASDYQWGWAAFHYGRWFYEDGYGWLWQPGHEWGPAWVKWGQSNGYYGWAPLGPHIEANQQWTPPERSWTFVRAEHLNKPNVEQYTENRQNNHVIVQNVTVINNTTVINKYVTNNNVVTNNVVNNSVVNNNVVNNNVVNNNHVVNNVVNNNVNNNVVNNNSVINNSTVNNNINNTNIKNVSNTNLVNNTAVKNVSNNNVVNNNVYIKNVVNNTTLINKGPLVEEVQKATNTTIPKTIIQINTIPAKTQVVNNNLQVYRPVIQPNGMQKNGTKAMPQKVDLYKKM